MLKLSPLIVFVVLYLVTSIVAGDFYKLPITVAFMLSSIYAIAISRGMSLEKRIETFSRGAGQKNMMLMIWIFILAGAFAKSAKDMGSIDATVNLALSILPANMLLGGMFLAACFISLSVGTSVGTIAALTPIAVGIAHSTGSNVALLTAIVVGGSFFGDNLSFISDTTVVATQTQGCKMSDKFKANIRIVEQPFGSRLPIAPRKLVIMLLALILGIVVPFVYFRLRIIFDTTVHGRKDIEKYTTIPILCDVPHTQGSTQDSEIVVVDQKDDVIAEAFRMMRFNMQFINKDARVVMLTSTMPGEGKTFISRNFAATLGMGGKKVVLIDADIRKRTQSRLSSMGGKLGLTSYLSGAEDDVLSLVTTRNKECNLDFLPAGIAAPNPTELLMSDRLERCIEELRKHYDYVIIDNVPAQMVADAGITGRVADMTIYVLRETKIDRRFLPELEDLHQEKKFNHLCIVLNDSRYKYKKYGYGYGYGSSEKKKRWNLFGRK